MLMKLDLTTTLSTINSLYPSVLANDLLLRTKGTRTARAGWGRKKAIIVVALREQLTVICKNKKLIDENGDEIGSNSNLTTSLSFHCSALGSAARTGTRVSFAATLREWSPTAIDRMLVFGLSITIYIKGIKKWKIASTNLETTFNKVKPKSRVLKTW